MRWTSLIVAYFLFVSSFAGEIRADEPATLAGTQPLTWDGDIASRLVDGVDRFLLKKTESVGEAREQYWKRDVSSLERYTASLEPNRQRLSAILGVRDARVPFESPEFISTLTRPAMVGRGEGYVVFAVRWPTFADVHGEGLLLVPTRGAAKGDVIAIPDADQTPEQLVGLAEGVKPESQFARRLAESGCRVMIPVLIDRKVEARNGRAKLTSREFVYRPAFELGRHVIGYEVQKVLALVDWLTKEKKGKVGVIGWGQGGQLALYAGALDPRIDAVAVSAYLEDRRNLWKEPLDRNVFGLLEEFGDAEIAAMIAPRTLVIEAAKGPEVVVPPGTGGGPGRLTTPDVAVVRKEVERARKLVAGLKPAPRIELVESGDGTGPYGSEPALTAFVDALAAGEKLAPVGAVPASTESKVDSAARQLQQLHELDRHSQQLLEESPYVRQAFMSKVDPSSLAKFQQTIEPYRTTFRDDVIGRFVEQPLSPNVRSRKVYDEPKYTGYEVVMDVFPDVFAYGILLLPKGVKDGEKRPVVVCQHGLEGRPQDVADPKINNPAYNQFAIRLAERGFVTFSPQNLYIFQDRFRTLQRKANPLKKTLFSIIIPQHQQITDWLKAQPFVDPERIGFYGLSYGGKSAMRIPALVSNYCLSICSADFNNWVWKNASTRSPYSYVWTPEYEIFEFDLGSTFNYAEMGWLIAPRPFMVERGHFDGVAPDEEVAYEFAKIRFLYNGKLGIGDRCEIEWFAGPHTIHGVGTYDFLHKHLKWPKP